jgi:hypothetical protein
MAYFVFLFAGNAGNEWLDKKLDQMADHPSDELTEKKEFKVGRKIEFKYAPSQKGIMITASADH